jgi:NTE family protein
MTDLVLSSGFLAFARQAGFLAAVEEQGLQVGGVCGTSSGALAGAMWASGMNATEIATEMSSRRPLALCSPHLAPWRGLFTMSSVIRRLSELLPPRFEDLERPFGVGVMSPQGSHRLITSGPLPQAVAASMAIPTLFVPVELDERPWCDGAFADRTALEPWLAHRGPSTRALVHLVDSSDSGGAEPDPELAPLVRTPRSFARLWSLGDFEAQLQEARERTLAVLASLDPADYPRSV